MNSVTKILSFFFAITFGFSASAAVVPAQKMQMDLARGESTVEFNAIGKPNFLKIKGVAKGLNGNLILDKKNFTGKIEFDLNALETGISLRDKHMKEKYLESTKSEFAHAVLTLTDVKMSEDLASNKSAKMSDCSFKGKLKLHGVEKEIEGKANVNRTGDEIEVNASFDLLIADYGIEIPSYAGIKVANEVKLAVEIKAPIAQVK